MTDEHQPRSGRRRTPSKIMANMVFGARVKSLRIERKMSGKELADEIGVSHQQLYKYENGDNAISAGALSLICKALDISVTDFHDDIVDRLEDAQTLYTTH